MSIESFHQRMKDLAKSFNLPVLHPADVDDDLKILTKYGSIQYVWMLRDAGTVLLPLSRGVDVDYFHQYAHLSEKILLLDLAKEEIKLIDPEKAIELGNRDPLADQILSSNLEAFENQVNTVLEYRHWGVFYPPQMNVFHWDQWLEYFKKQTNHLMIRFIERVIAHRKSILRSNRAA